MKDEKELLPEWYKYKEQPFYKGDGVLNILELESLCRDFTEYIHQQQVIKQRMSELIK